MSMSSVSTIVIIIGRCDHRPSDEQYTHLGWIRYNQSGFAFLQLDPFLLCCLFAALLWQQQCRFWLCRSFPAMYRWDSSVKLHAHRSISISKYMYTWCSGLRRLSTAAGQAARAAAVFPATHHSFDGFGPRIPQQSPNHLDLAVQEIVQARTPAASFSYSVLIDGLDSCYCG